MLTNINLVPRARMIRPDSSAPYPFKYQISAKKKKQQQQPFHTYIFEEKPPLFIHSKTHEFNFFCILAAHEHKVSHSVHASDK